MEKKGLPYLIRCTSCHAKNRIPADKINASPKCGKCHSPLNIKDIFIGHSVNVTESTFDTEVLKSPISVLVLFWATWCSACQAVIPTVERIAQNLKGRIKVAKVNMDQNPRLASQFNVLSVPLMLIVENGKSKETMTGALTELQILQKLSHYY